MFNDSQWPGYVTKVPIYAETDDAYYMPSDVFLSNGFFVSSYLAASEFIALKDLSESFARNTMLFVEYELSTGVVEVNYAIGLLPDEVMPQRVADDRVGYFSKRYTQYSTTDQVQRDENGYYRWDPQMTVIHRRKIELNSTTNTTKDPITYYIDPSVPKEWREAFRSGVEAWSPAFERIGLPNAIRAVVPGDSNWPSDYRLGDLRYNSISAMISEETYALGPSIIDPRSGEILHSDIVFEYGFFNEIMAAFDIASVAQPQSRKHPKSSDTEPLKNITKKKSRIRTGKTRQCGYAYEEQHRLDRMLLSSFAADETGRVPKRLIAQHFASIVMHEVGHTLGLRHNFAGSSAYSHSQLRNPAFVAEHGVSSSIMDYLPANIFSDLTKDEVEKHGFFMTGIGKYDYAAIAYGYSMVDNEIPGYKHPRLTEVAAAAPLFLPDEAVENMLNPFAQLFDMSSDLVGYAADRVKFVKNARSTKAMLKNLPEDTSWTALWQRERFLLRMLEQAVEIVQPLLGGVNVTHAHRSHAESSYKASFVPKGTQMKALELILRVIRAENGLFPQVEDYGSFVEVVGFNDENCDEDALDYHCLGRGLVDVGANVLYVREYAVIASLFPAMERIVQQEILSPMTLSELLCQVNKALKDQPVSYTLETFVNELLREIVNHRTTDPRIKKAVETVYPTVRASQAMEVPGDFSKRISRL